MAIIWGRGDVMEQKGSHEKHGFRLHFFLNYQEMKWI